MRIFLLLLALMAVAGCADKDCGCDAQKRRDIAQHGEPTSRSHSGFDIDGSHYAVHVYSWPGLTKSYAWGGPGDGCCEISTITYRANGTPSEPFVETIEMERGVFE